MSRGRPPVDPWERILTHVVRNEESKCWEWNGFKNKLGYGLFWLNNKHHRVHKFSLEKKLNRKLQTDEVTRHLCNNPCCCNPDHLEAGSHQDNANDKVLAGRQAKGEKNGASKLTDSQISEIRAYQGMYTRSELADMYNVHTVHISRIHNNRTRYFD